MSGNFLDDQQRGGDRCMRETTENVHLEYKAVKKGYRITDQHDTEPDIGHYELDQYGDILCSGHIDKGNTTHSTNPPSLGGNRIISAGGWMIEGSLSEDNTRVHGAWIFCAPGALRPEGAFVIEDMQGNDQHTLVGKKMVNSPSSDDWEEIKNITGSNSPYGMPGLILPVSNQDKQGFLFIPTGGIIAVDHLHGEYSTKIFPVTATGWIDSEKPASIDAILRVIIDENSAYVPALNMEQSGQDTTGFGPCYFKNGSTEILAYLSAKKDFSCPLHPGTIGDPHELATNINPVHITTKANYIDADATTLDGPLDFDPSAAHSDNGEVDNYDHISPVHLQFDTASGKWKWSVKVKTATSLVYARICWAYNYSSDGSFGEIVTYNTVTGLWAASGTIIWIDWEWSKSAKYETMGTDTIFTVDLLEKDVTRTYVTRDLYAAKHCKHDMGYKFTHLGTYSKTSSSIMGYFLSSELVASPWTSTNSIIVTEIDGSEYSNMGHIRLPSQWSLSGPSSYQFLELHDLGHGMPFFFRPIRPIVTDSDDLYTWQSAEEITGTTIAGYDLA